MKLGVMSDSHVGRAVPREIADIRRQDYRYAFSKAMDCFIEEEVDVILFGGDLFEKRSMTPSDSTFVKEEFQRLIDAIREKAGKRVKIYVIRGNHDGSSETSVISYVSHPLAQYLKLIGDRTLRGEDEYCEEDGLLVVGISYHPFIASKFVAIKPLLMKRFTESKAATKILLLHNFIRGYHRIPPGVPDHNTYTVRDFDGIPATYIISGHYHNKMEPFKSSETIFLSSCSTEAVDLSDTGEHGVWVMKDNGMPHFIKITPLHKIHNIEVDSQGAVKATDWFVDQADLELRGYATKVANATNGEGTILRLVLTGKTDGDPYTIEKALEPKIAELKQEAQRVKYVEFVNRVETMEHSVTLPSIASSGTDYATEILKPLEDKQEEAMKMIEEVSEALDERPSQKTGLLMGSDRDVFVNRWVQFLEKEENKK